MREEKKRTKSIVTPRKIQLKPFLKCFKTTLYLKCFVRTFIVQLVEAQNQKQQRTEIKF